jgi:8-oxo-dGTP pyrophosphatase MutT (NUDIX family)
MLAVMSRLPPRSFDPRLVPVLPAGPEALPAVAPERLTPQALRQRFAHPPAWAPEVRREPPFMPRTPAQAAVLMPVVMHARPSLILTQRTEHLPTHAGQVALPGGRVDPDDGGVVAAALREAQEEIGLDPARVEVLGTLPEYITGSAFHVTPVVALVEPGFELRPNPHEVADVFEVPLDFLMNPAHHRLHVHVDGGHERRWYSMPYRDGAVERFIWGATAGMLRNLYRFLAAG